VAVTDHRVDALEALEILDSRGLPTLEVTLRCGTTIGRASVPSGKSTGRNEALELRDGDRSRFGGKGVLTAVSAVNGAIATALIGHALPDAEQLDRQLSALDGTPNKSRLGANAVLGVSVAAARVRSAGAGVALYASLGGSDAVLLPVPCFNVINGGAHAPNDLDFQEFMLVPAGFASFAEALRAGAETYHALARLLAGHGLLTAVGDEGGFAPAIKSPTEALDWIVRAIEAAGYRPGEQLFIALDPAANGFETAGRYKVVDEMLDAGELTSLYEQWLGKYPILSIEDGLAEDDIDGWRHLTRTLGRRTQIVGDDIFVSDPGRITWAIKEGIANAVLLKPNQIGTVTELLAAVAVARAAGYRMMVSHRSGETDDSFIADLAVAIGCGQIKAGAPARGERVAKYNRLLAIEHELGPRARYAGRAAFELTA
jgi:enolase